ncbi:type II toxin-antitoxin system HicB family antitoxin [Propionivibrio sp.]|uniref:type II toxin-antitoxin system HicB family antitoxin n=1 Tax=Propionivibrio sp. TaxID=2212460 RepID=UPI003BF358CA
MNLLYPATFEPQPDGGFTVLFPDLPEAITEGDTFDEAMMHAQEVLSLSLRGRIEDESMVPRPSNERGEHIHLVAPDTKSQSAALLRLARGDRPMSEIARALDTSWASAQRLEDPNHWPSLKQLDRAARVLGKRLVLSLE